MNVVLTDRRRLHAWRPPHLSRSAVTFASICLMFWGGGCGRSEEPQKYDSSGQVSMTSSASEQQWQCGGRFAFIAGAVNVMDRSQSIYRTNVTTLAMPPNGIDGYWATRLGRNGSPPRPVELQAGVKSAWSARNAAFPKILTLEAVSPVRDGLLLVDREADAGKEDVAETLVRDIINAFVPSTEHGFCVGTGAIALEPSQNEQVRLTLAKSDAPDVEVRFQTRTVREPDTSTYSNLDEEKSLVASRGGTLNIVRDGARVAADMSGKEIWIAVAVPNEPALVRFTWHFAGEASSPTHPSIDIVGTTTRERTGQLESLWESILGSLRAIPLGESVK